MKKVFICYAKEDWEIAKKIYDDLKRPNIKPWIAKEDINPGEYWKNAIRQAIKGSSYFLALLSENSISKRGYVQRELKIAFDMLGELPNYETYIIPVRINECNPVDEKLKEIQWVNLYPYEKCLDKILDVLKPDKSCPNNIEELIQMEPSYAYLQHDDLLEEIKKYLAKARKHIVLYGEPMVGKNKILQRLANQLSDDYVPLIITSQLISVSSSLDAFIFDLADQLTDKFKFWAKQQDISINNIVDPDWNNYRKGKSKREFYTHWHQLQQRAGKKRMLVMFDEVEHLLDDEDKSDQQIFIFLDKFICNPENGLFILAGSERIQYRNNEKFSMLIGGGKTFRVSFYEEETAANVFSVLKKYFKNVDNILQYSEVLCDGHPRLLEITFETIVSHLNTRSENLILEPMLIEVIKKASNFLWALAQRLSPEEIAVVWLISKKLSVKIQSCGFNCFLNYFECFSKELIELANQYHIEQLVDINKGLADLEERQWIAWKDWKGKLFRFKLCIFPLWILYRHISINLNTMKFEIKRS
ncbi:MAG: TIR domain-containing protein [Desulfobacteraceae bacterium]|nr:TIR domain-containing protein [Desulfobacteraceae bacterium]